ncbi:alpha/beta fold hydrolase [Sphingomonas colocasiae]|uniref:Alpha/beta hydrolase n=1 Tax=Sphingomonas colocasiae TaxID=1848973 RepID=A0ABS7PL47_9SPHN|nr:alpha/beta fold hydrolase [Sphingomonas colocasiae]MBY8821958.1 alpha/beta hydrolase [Sphingomonas colocasiae]
MTAANPFTSLERRLLRFEDMAVNAWEGGSGPSLLMLHGSGPGASSVGNWRPVLDRLTAHFRVLAIDLIGFGESGRRPAPPFFDTDLWLRQAQWALALLPGEAVGVIGHSLSGALALRLAARDGRVAGVLATGTMGGDMPVNPHLDHVWRCPRSRDAMRAAGRTLIADERLITDTYLDQRMAVIGAPGYADYFDAMFAGPFDRFIAAARVTDADLARIAVPVMMLHGLQDRAFPAEPNTLALLPRLARGDALLLSNCSHSVAMERPDALVAAAIGLFGKDGL